VGVGLRGGRRGAGGGGGRPRGAIRRWWDEWGAGEEKVVRGGTSRGEGMNRRGQGCGRGQGARKETVWEEGEGRGEKEGGGEEEGC
jgi:hypothetical protein